MALTITATVNPLTYSVTLLVTGGSPEYVVEAGPAGDREPYPVRTTWSLVTGTPSSRLGFDGAAPLNVDVQYVATDALGAQATSAVVRVTATGPVLSDALDPNAFVTLPITAQKPNRWEARSVWFDVLGQSEPFVSVAPMRLRSGPLEVYAADSTDRARLIGLLMPGHPLTLRTTCEDAVDDVTMLPLSVEERLIVADDPTGPTSFTIDYQAVSGDLGPYTADAGRAYTMLLTESTTYAGLLGLWPTYQAMLAGDANAGLGAETIVDGAMALGAVSWSTFWSSAYVAWSWAGGTALATIGPGGTGPAVLRNSPADKAVPVGGALVRVTGRVRASRPSVTARVDLHSNTVAGQATYFGAGVATGTAVIPVSAVWERFAVDVPLADLTDTIYNLSFRGDGLLSADTIEWDDLSARWFL